MTRFSLGRCAVLAAVGSVGFLSLSTNAQAQMPAPPHRQLVGAAKLSADAAAAANNNPSGTVKVIVQYKTADKGSQELLLGRSGARSRYQFRTSNAAAVEVPASTLASLANEDGVAYVSYDRPLGARFQPATAATAAAAKLASAAASALAAPATPVAATVAAPGPSGVTAVSLAGSIASNAEYTTDAINAPAVWASGYFGTGIGVAVIDSGVAPLADLNVNGGLGTRVVYSQSFPATLNGGTGDPYGHGTHVAGLIAGNGLRSTGPLYARTFYGVAPNANIINLRVLDENGEGTDSTVIQAIETAIQLKSQYNIRVINLSLGRGIFESYTTDPLCQAVEAAWQSGIVVVAAAGNDGRDQAGSPEGYGTINAPGNDPYVITVGAINTMGTPGINDDILGSYSSKGPSFMDFVAKPDVVAPGNLVTSLLASPADTLQSQNPTFYTPTSFYIKLGQPLIESQDYMPLSGTSMATGVVSGAVALMLSANPSLTPDQVKALLMLSSSRNQFPTTSTVTDNTTGITYTDHYDALSVGAGYIDVNAAVQAVWHQTGTLPQGTAMSPIVSYDATSNTASLLPDPSAMWNAGGVVAPAAVYGGGAFLSGTTALWGKAVLTGASDPEAYTALWGKTALWGRSTPDAATALWGRSAGAGDTNSSSASTDNAGDGFSLIP